MSEDKAKDVDCAIWSGVLSIDDCWLACGEITPTHLRNRAAAAAALSLSARLTLFIHDLLLLVHHRLTVLPPVPMFCKHHCYTVYLQNSGSRSAERWKSQSRNGTPSPRGVGICRRTKYAVSVASSSTALVQPASSLEMTARCVCCNRYLLSQKIRLIILYALSDWEMRAFFSHGMCALWRLSTTVIALLLIASIAK